MVENESDLTVEAAEGVLIITIDRPRVRNALSPEVVRGLVAAFRRLDEEPSLRVGVLTGAGGYFSAGMDLARFIESGEPFDDTVVRAGRAAKPLIAAVEGFALAGGLELALACDLIVASTTAKLGIPEVKRGIIASGGGLARLPLRLPFHLAMELALTGDPVSGERAAAMGLVNVCVPPGQVLGAARELAARIAVNSPQAVRHSKTLVRDAADRREVETWVEQAAAVTAVLASPDSEEGSRAFLERREPLWAEERVYD